MALLNILHDLDSKNNHRHGLLVFPVFFAWLFLWFGFFDEFIASALPVGKSEDQTINGKCNYFCKHNLYVHKD
jgi:hypothetical protein